MRWISAASIQPRRACPARSRVGVSCRRCPENLSDYVRRTLAKKCVEVMTSSRVISRDAHGIELKHGRLDAVTTLEAKDSKQRYANACHRIEGRNYS